MIQDEILRLQGEDAAGALSTLIALAKKKQERLEIDAALGKREAVVSLLSSDAPKVRKNAARLLGTLCHKEDAAALSDALQAESTKFVIPSILLALGSIGTDAAKAALEGYTVPTPVDETEKKHCKEIAEARQKALLTFDTDAFPVLTMLPQQEAILLVAPDGFSDVLADELTALSYQPTVIPQGVVVRTANIGGLFRARCFFEALIPLGRVSLSEVSLLAEAFRPHLILPYRVELRNFSGDRRALIDAFTEKAGGVNSPSHYAVEARIVCDGDTALCYAKYCCVPDERFAYRLEALPASIHPATAAAILRAVLPYTDGRRVRVLDPFCGSGTMLLEAEKVLDCSSLTGVDVAENAIRAARTNAAAASSRARFVHKDILRFDTRVEYDVIVANLPFGNRVGTHADNTQLYRAFVKRLPALLATDGVAVLYTMESTLLKKCLSAESGLRVTRQKRTEAGGLLPYVFFARHA